MRENICKQSNGQRINLQNMQTAPGAQYQYNNKPNQKMGRRRKQTSLQRRHIDGQGAHERMLNNTNYWRNANQKYNEVSITSHWSEWLSSKNLQTINAGEGVEKREPSCTIGGSSVM